MAFYQDQNRRDKEQKRRSAEMRGGFEDEGTRYSNAGPSRGGRKADNRFSGSRPAEGRFGGGSQGGPRGFAPRGQGPRSQGDNRVPQGFAPRGQAPRPQGDNRGPRDFGPRGQGPRPQGDNRGPRDFGPRDFAPRGQGPRPQGDNPGPQGFAPRGQNPRPQGGHRGPRDFGPRDFAPRGQGPRPQGDNRGPQGFAPRGQNPRPQGGPRSYEPRPQDGPRPQGAPPKFGPRPYENRPSEPRPYDSHPAHPPRPPRPPRPQEAYRPQEAFRPVPPAPPAYGAPSSLEAADNLPAENLLSGRNPIREALKSGRDIEKLLVARGELSGSAREIVEMAKERHIPVQEVDRVRLDAITAGHQGMLAFASAYQYHTVDDMLALAKEKGQDPFLVLLDGITDPHNLGAIIRTAECAGAHGVIVQERRAVGLTPAAVKASAGAVEYLPVARVTNLTQTIAQLKNEKLWIYAADMEGEDYAQVDFSGPIALVVGGEGEGVSRLVLEACDRRVSLPLRGQLDSLNASVAAGILLYAAMKGR